MTAFRKKNIATNKRVCLRLKEARKTAGISLNILASRTKISKEYLRALEECEFEILPTGEIYQKNFLKRYLEALNIDPKPFLHQFVDEEMGYIEQKKQVPSSRKYTGITRFSNLPLILRYVCVGLVVVLVIGYLVIQVKHIVEPPILILFSPQNGYISNQPTILVQGETEKEVRISINGKEIRNNEEGQFNEKIDLSPGLNTIIVTAEKKHGKTTVETRYIVLKEENQ